MSLASESDWNRLLLRAAINEPDALSQLRSEMVSQPHLCTRRLMDFILSRENAEQMGCCDLLAFLSELLRMEAVVQWVSEVWPNAAPEAKRKICSWAHLPGDAGMPTDLIVKLFDDPTSTVTDRHLLVAGLSSTAMQRCAESLVLELIERVGSYDDPGRNAPLSRFKDAIRASFSSYRK